MRKLKNFHKTILGKQVFELWLWMCTLFDCFMLFKLKLQWDLNGCLFYAWVSIIHSAFKKQTTFHRSKGFKFKTLFFLLS